MTNFARLNLGNATAPLKATVAGVTVSSPTFTVMPSALSGSLTSLVTTHLRGSAKVMLLNVVGNDGGNQDMGLDPVGSPAGYPGNFVGSGSKYYRWWMKIMPGFVWPTGGSKTKSSRIGVVSPGFTGRGYTGYLRTYGILIGECEGIGTGGGALPSGAPSDDFTMSAAYDFTTKDDGLWHEYIARVQVNSVTGPNTTFTPPDSSLDAELELFVDGVSISSYTGFRLHNETDAAADQWWFWMMYCYFQMGAGAGGGDIYLGEYSTDDAFNSVFSLGKPTSLAVS